MKRNRSNRISPKMFHSARFTGRFLIINFIVIGLLLTSAGMAVEKILDYKAYKDPELFSRLPNYYLSSISSFLEKQFDSYTFWVTEGKKTIKQPIEGHFTQYYYYFDRSVGPAASTLQVIRNYQNAATKIGGQVLFDNSLKTTLRIVKNDRETWVEITPLGGGSTYYVKIVERQAMQQQVTANADALQTALTQTGHVEVPGIFFDFGKAEVKPESEPALQEIAKLLTANSSLRVWVVGHTDYVGSADANVALAGARATAVVKALTQKYNIDAKRLTPYGVGPYAPVASNAAEEGRAKNRRVELVIQPSP